MRSTLPSCRLCSVAGAAGWFSQLLLIAAIVLLAVCGSDLIALAYPALAALLVAAASATQDIVIDAFRSKACLRANRPPEWHRTWQPTASGMLASTAGALFLVTGFEDFAQNLLPGWPVIWRWLRWSSSVS
jgi:PAT family beta-lactamase induction signal transducer AmpG